MITFLLDILVQLSGTLSSYLLRCFRPESRVFTDGNSSGRFAVSTYGGEEISGRHRLRHRQSLPELMLFRMELPSWPERTVRVVTGELRLDLVNRDESYTGRVCFYHADSGRDGKPIEVHDINFLKKRGKFIGVSAPRNEGNSPQANDGRMIHYTLVWSKDNLSLSGRCRTADGVEHPFEAVKKI